MCMGFSVHLYDWYPDNAECPLNSMTTRLTTYAKTKVHQVDTCIPSPDLLGEQALDQLLHNAPAPDPGDMILKSQTIQALDTANYYAPHIQLSTDFRDRLQQVQVCLFPEEVREEF